MKLVLSCRNDFLVMPMLHLKVLSICILLPAVCFSIPRPDLSVGSSGVGASSLCQEETTPMDGDDICVNVPFWKISKVDLSTVKGTIWWVHLITKTTTPIPYDVEFCSWLRVDPRGKCRACKVQFSDSDCNVGELAFENWGTTRQELTYMQGQAILNSHKNFILSIFIENLMKVERGVTCLSTADQQDEVTATLQSTPVAVVGGDNEKVLIFESCCDAEGVITVLITEEIYQSQDTSDVDKIIDKYLGTRGITREEMWMFTEDFPDATDNISTACGDAEADAIIGDDCGEAGSGCDYLPAIATSPYDFGLEPSVDYPDYGIMPIGGGCEGIPGCEDHLTDPDDFIGHVPEYSIMPVVT